MKKISSASPVSRNESKVARYIDLQIRALEPKTQTQIADEAELPQRNLLSMIRTGTTKLPFERIPGIAKALKVDQNHLFRMALEEYQPNIKNLFDAAGQQAVSQYERELLAVWREATRESDPPIEPVKREIVAAAEHARGLAIEAAALSRGRRW